GFNDGKRAVGAKDPPPLGVPAGAADGAVAAVAGGAGAGDAAGAGRQHVGRERVSAHEHGGGGRQVQASGQQAAAFGDAAQTARGGSAGEVLAFALTSK